MSDNIQDELYLSDEGPAALVIREHLMPVEGRDGVLFPSTYAAGDGFEGGYNIDGDPGGENVCLIDSVGSQANRIEPIFKENQYKHLVPQVVVTAGENAVSILDAGHRAGDALVRCSGLEKEFSDAFKAALRGNDEPLARIAPTSLVFGVWDSRDTQAKRPRLVSSTIRAYNVRKLTRHAQYVPPLDYVAAGQLEEPNDLRDAEGKIKGKHPFAQRGFTHLPVTKPESTRGGVIATGGIRRDATLSLVALRLLAAKDNKLTLILRRYILGLALTAFTYQPTGYLRQGCLLVLDPEKPRELSEVFLDGKRKPANLTHKQALDYAKLVADTFGVIKMDPVLFKPELAKKDLEKAKKAKKTE